jgi:hypothetical protein
MRWKRCVARMRSVRSSMRVLASFPE